MRRAVAMLASVLPCASSVPMVVAGGANFESPVGDGVCCPLNRPAVPMQRFFTTQASITTA